MKILKLCTLLTILAILALSTGCKQNTKLKRNSIKLETSKKQSIAVTDLEGASFNVESNGTMARIIVIPGVFPAGTSVSITPLSKDSGLKGDKYSTFFEVKAISDKKSIQPSMPVFLTLALEKELPDTACLVAYNDGDSIGYKVKSQIFRENGISYITAELNHFTIIGIGDDGTATLAPPGVDEGGSSDIGSSGEEPEDDGEWKEWRFEVNGPPESLAIEDNEVWDFDAHMRLTAVNTGGYIAGFYSGEPVITITGKAKEGVVPKNELNLELIGKISSKLSGATEFYLGALSKDSNIITELLPGDPDINVGELLMGRGSMQLIGSSSLDIQLTGEGVLPDAGYEGNGSGQQNEYHVDAYVSAQGASIMIRGLGSWKAVMVGVPKGGLPPVSSGERSASSDTQISAASDAKQPGGLFNLFREGWPGENIPDEIPEYPKGEVVNSGGDEREYTILVDNTTQEDLDEYIKALEEDGWYTSFSDYAMKNNLTLYFQFHAKNFLQIIVVVEELGTWSADKLPAEILPPEKGMLIGDVDIADNSNGTAAYYIAFNYSGLSEDDVWGYMETYLDRGWEGDQYYVKGTIKWKGKQYKVDMEPYFNANIVSFMFNLIEQ